MQELGPSHKDLSPDVQEGCSDGKFKRLCVFVHFYCLYMPVHVVCISMFESARMCVCSQGQSLET